MDYFLSRFHISDLEQFSGIKAHTIRAWERRYRLLEPGRTDTNIRTYDLAELKIILNVAYLNQRGYKISRIAAMTADAREQLVRSAALEEQGTESIINSLVLAMLSLNEALFTSISGAYESDHGFRALVERVFIKLLERIGLLWQSSAICPAQEHFVSNIIRKRLIVAGAQQPVADGPGTVYVLHLPENEIHELGLLYVDYLLRSHGRRTIYLGQSVPQADLRQVVALHPGNLVFIGLYIVTPAPEDASAHLQKLRLDMPDERVSFLCAGAPLRDLDAGAIPSAMKVFPNLAALVAEVDQL
ncbi:MAG: MerR family transcriptional regulator [Flavobacteriales bacterium]|nr:MerR family transcriptional regulator [Flavobacteriales bacterium]